MWKILFLLFLFCNQQDQDSIHQYHLRAQKETVETIETITTAIISYCKAQHLDATPKISLQELFEKLVNEGLLKKDQLLCDGWDHELQYSPGNLDSFVILSTGADRTREEYLPQKYNNFNFALDIVSVGGQLTKAPLRFFPD